MCVFVSVLRREGLQRRDRGDFVHGVGSDTAQPVHSLCFSFLPSQEHAVAPHPHHPYNHLCSTGKFSRKKSSPEQRLKLKQVKLT